MQNDLSRLKIFLLLFISPLGVPISMYLYNYFSSGHFLPFNIGFFLVMYLNGCIGSILLGIPVFNFLKKHDKERSFIIVFFGFFAGFSIALPLLFFGIGFIDLALLFGVSGASVALVFWIFINVILGSE